jgi:hypothetical protein
MRPKQIESQSPWGLGSDTLVEASMFVQDRCSSLRLRSRVPVTPW